MEEWQRLLKDGVNNAQQLFDRFGVDKALALAKDSTDTPRWRNSAFLRSTLAASGYLPM